MFHLTAPQNHVIELKPARYRLGQAVESLDGGYSGVIRKRIYGGGTTGPAHITEVELQRFGGMGAVRLPVTAIRPITPPAPEAA